MTYRQPLTPVPYSKRTEPTKALTSGMDYTAAVSTDIRTTFRQARYRQLGEQSCMTEVRYRQRRRKESV